MNDPLEDKVEQVPPEIAESVTPVTAAEPDAEDETLPNRIDLESTASSATAAEPEAEAADNSPLALVVEDDADAAFIARRAMMDNGCRVEVVHRGDEAVEVLDTLRPDVILLDLHLPAMSGVDILRRIRANDELQETKVILVTADHATADMIAQSADMVLLKPVMYTQLRDLVKRLLKRIQ